MLRNKLKLVPQKPGCYIMYNANQQVIYVGKAKNLKNRINSYFNKSQDGKTALMLLEVVDFEYVITNSENESLLLEINLIKNHQPKYNIRLIDDKTYPYIEITKEEHPRLLVVRMHKYNKGRTLFGPFPSSYAAKETVRLLQKIFPLRRCNPIGRRPCLYYQIGQCLGPCAGLKNIDYETNIKVITKFLKGDTTVVINKLKEQMNLASNELEYEKALEYRELINNVYATTEKQIMSLNDFTDRDIIGYALGENTFSVCIFQMRQGRILDTHQKVLSGISNDLDEVSQYLYQFYEKMQIPEEIIVSKDLGEELGSEVIKAKLFSPQRGAKKQMLDLAFVNANDELNQNEKLVEIAQANKYEIDQFLFNLIGKNVNYLESFDNAQLFGANLVAGMIVVKNQEFERKLYRKYQLKTTTNDDYQAMYEIVYRRYHRLLINNKEFPDLVVVDGGKGQVNKAKQALSDLSLNLAVVGMLKDNNHRLKSLVFNDEVIDLSQTSPIYKFFGKISEETHRYTIDYHRSKRQVGIMKSKLDDVKGLGPVRLKKLLSSFQTLDDIKNASIDEIVSAGLPNEVAVKVKEVLNRWLI